jgi:hypothetical protein
MATQRGERLAAADLPQPRHFTRVANCGHRLAGLGTFPYRVYPHGEHDSNQMPHWSGNRNAPLQFQQNDGYRASDRRQLQFERLRNRRSFHRTVNEATPVSRLRAPYSTI